MRYASQILISLLTWGQRRSGSLSGYEVIERVNVMLFLESSPVHVTANVKVPTVLFFDRSHVGVVAFLAQLPTLISAPVAFHTFSVFSHSS